MYEFCSWKALADKLQVEKNSKPFWNYMRSIRKGTNDLLFLKEGSAEIAGHQEIAQHMNAYFASVFTHEHKTLPEFDYVLDEKLCNVLCTPSEVGKHLKNLNIHKSPGPDKLLPRILKECALELSTSLCNRFNLARYPVTGKLHILFQSIKRDQNTKRKTIAKSR